MMLARFSRIPHGFNLLEGNIHVMDSPPTHELEMPNAHVGPFIQGLPCDPPPSWRMLSKFQTSARHYVHQAWQILLSPSLQLFVNLGHGPPSL